MSNEGITLVTRAALVISLGVVASIFRALVGASRRRGLFMLAGTLGGMASGVAASYYLISPLIATDASVICACLGMMAGWGVAWPFARQVPREAN